MPNKVNRLCFFLWIFAMNLNGETASETKPIASHTVSPQFYRNGGDVNDLFSGNITSPYIFLSIETGMQFTLNCLTIHTKDNPCSWAASYPQTLPIATETKLNKKE